MFIHIGNDKIIRTREIILIIDYEVIASSTFMEEMIEEHREQSNIIELASNVKSAVFTNDYIYFSPLSVPTIKKRSSIVSMIKKIEQE